MGGACDAGMVQLLVVLQVGYSSHELAEPPKELLMPLLPFQKQFLAWAIKQVGFEVRP